MFPEIRFTPFGIPYLVEFANVSFRSRRPKWAKSYSTSRSSSPAPSMCSSMDTCSSTITGTTLVSASSATLAYPEEEEEEGEGIYIQYASRQTWPPYKLSPSRLARLKYRIRNAVIAAGMDSSPEVETSNPMDDVLPGQSAPQKETASSALFRGTYGQVMAALEDAGLTTTSCKASGLEEATRLGVMFVARRTEHGTVELTKLTLWA